MKVCLLQIGYDIELQYNALKTFMPKDVEFDCYYLMDYYIKKQLEIFPRRDKKYEDLLVQKNKRMMKNFQEFLPIFLLMVKNFRSGIDIFHQLKKQYDNLNYDNIKYNFSKIDQMRTQTEDFLRDISIEKYDVVGISTTDGGIYNSVIAILMLRDKYPDKKIIIGGGLFKTYKELREILLRLNLVDTFVDGDGELALPHIIQNQEFPKEINMPVHDLDSLPFPEPGFESFLWKNDNTSANIYSSRGCPNKCSFCNEGINSFRCLSAERLGSWVRKTITDYKTDRIVIADNLLCPSETYIETFYRSIEDLVGKFTLVFAQIHPKIMNKNIIKMMKNLDARIFLGIESFSQNILDKMQKQTTVEQNIKVIDECLKYGLDIDMGRIFLFPGESYEDFFTSINYFTKYLNKTVQSVWLNNMTLYPETPIYKNPDAFNIQFINFDNEIAEIVPEVRDIILKYPRDYIDLTDPDDVLYDKKYKILRTTNEVLCRIFLKKWRKEWPNFHGKLK